MGDKVRRHAAMVHSVMTETCRVSINSVACLCDGIYNRRRALSSQESSAYFLLVYLAVRLVACRS